MRGLALRNSMELSLTAVPQDRSSMLFSGCSRFSTIIVRARNHPGHTFDTKRKKARTYGIPLTAIRNRYSLSSQKSKSLPELFVGFSCVPTYTHGDITFFL